MIKVRANKTTVGEYGKLRKGEVADVRPSVAKRLEKSGTVEILSDDGQPELTPGKEHGITIRQGGEVLFNSLEDRKVIRSETVITPESVVSQPIVEKVEEITDTIEQLAPQEDTKEPEPEKKKEVEQPVEKKVEQKETPKKEYKK